MHHANTAASLGQGNAQATVVYAMGLVPTDDEAAAYPQLDFQARFGVTERLDLGAGLGLSGLQGHAKIQLTRPESDSWIVAVSPMGGFGLHSQFADLDLIVGRRVGAHELSMSVFYGAFHSTESAETELGGLLNWGLIHRSGGAVVIALRTKGTTWLPQVGVQYWNSPEGLFFSGRSTAWVPHAGLALQIGKSRDQRREDE